MPPAPYNLKPLQRTGNGEKMPQKPTPQNNQSAGQPLEINPTAQDSPTPYKTRPDAKTQPPKNPVELSIRKNRPDSRHRMSLFATRTRPNAKRTPRPGRPPSVPLAQWSNHPFSRIPTSHSTDNQLVTGQPHTRRTFLLLIALIALAAAGKAILFDTLDPDCFWHLRVADQLASDGIKPLIDHLTYGSVHARWTPYSWLAELAMKWVWDAAGFRGAVAACAIMSAGLVTLIAATSRSARTPLPPGKDDTATPSYLAATVAVAFAAFLCLPYLSFRPATLAILLLAAVYSLISRERSGTRRGKWIVLLTLILANVHLFAFLVPLWIGAIWAGELAARKPAWRWGILFIATSLASLCTPMLPGALAAVFNYQLNDPMVAGGVIAEMQPFWRGTFGLVSLLMVIAFFVVVIAKRKRFELTDFFLLAISTVALIEKGRFAPLFAIVAAPMLARALPNLSDRALQKPVLPRALAAIVLCGFIRLAAGFPYAGTSMDTWVNRHTPEGPGYPCGAAPPSPQQESPRSPAE